MATTLRPQTSPLLRDALAIGVVRASADNSTLVDPNGAPISPAIATGTAPPNNADGKPDGVIYIQTAA